MRTNQKGFSVVEILVVIVVIGLLGVVGWLVYDRQKGNTSNNASSQVNQQEQKYLEIKEEGIKIKLTDAISDAYYEYGVFGVRSLDSIIGCKVQKTVVDGRESRDLVAGLSFDKYASGFRTDQAPEASGFKDDPDAVRVGDNWYKMEVTDGGCTSTDPTIQAKIKAVKDAFKEAGKTITAL